MKMTENKAFYTNLIETIGCAYAYAAYIYNDSGKVLDCKIIDSNELFSDICGLSKDKIMDRKLSDLFADAKYSNLEWLKKLKTLKLKKKRMVFEEFFESLNRWYLIKISSHEEGYAILTFTDITASKLLDEETSHFFEMSLDLLSLLSFDGYFKKLSTSWVHILGWSLEELKSKPMIEFIHPDDVYRTIIMIQKLTEGRKSLDFENRYICKDGTYKWIQWRSNSVIDKEVIYAVARDVTVNKELELKLKEANRELKRKSITDSLTNVFNHQFITEILSKKIEVSRRYQQSLSVMMIDLDCFKKVNDQYGHLVGDEVLIKVVEKIKSCLRKADLLGRFGGEEFLLILPCTSLEGALTLSERIRKNIEQTTFDEMDLKVTVSIGVADYKEQDCSTLISQADKSMYNAKANGRNQIVCFKNTK